MEFWMALILALAVSADGFVVGIAYGIKKIRIPLLSLIVISLASAFAITIAMICGKGLGVLLNPVIASNVGAILLMVIGLYFILNAWRESLNKLQKDAGEPILTINIKPLGLIVHILKEPSTADLDRSGEISPREAFFLGFALALDAMGAGFGAAMTGFNILFTAVCVGMLKFILVNSGIILGSSINNQKLQSFSAVMAGIILIVIGVIEFI